MATFSNAIKKELNLYYSSSGTLLNKTGDLEANANDRETFNVNVYLEDGVTSNSTTLINFTPEERNTFTTHWFTMFYRGLVDFIVNNEEQPRTFAKFTMTIDSIVLLMKDGKINFTHNLTVIQRYGNTHLGNFATLSELITTNPPTQALDEDLSVAFVYSGETEVGFYQVEENGATYQWVKKNDILYNLSTKQYNVATLLVGKGFSNPNGLPTIEQSIVYQLMQEISYLSVRVSDLEVSLGVAENTLANHIINKNNPHEVKALQVDFDNTGTDLNETNTQDVIKEVNDKINSNTSDLETFKDVTVPETYETIASANIHKARTTNLETRTTDLETFKDVTVPNTYETKEDSNIHKARTDVLETFKNTTVPNTYETKVNATAVRALKVDKILTIIGLDLQNNISLEEFKTSLGNATQIVSGLMSAEDKTHLDNLVALFNEDSDDIVNTIAEILAVFENFPEGATILEVLATKVDKVAGKQLSTNDLTNTLKDYYDSAYAHSQIVNLNPHQTTYQQLLNKPTTIEELGVTNVYNKEYIDALKDQNGLESENLYNKETSTIGQFINPANGAVSSNATYSLSDYILVNPNKYYVKSGARQVVFFTKDKEFISGTSAGTTPFLTPSNCKYIRINSDLSFIELEKVEKGTSRTNYTPYEIKLKKEKIDGDFLGTPSMNLFNKAQKTLGSFINGTALGNLSSSSVLVASHFIDVFGDTDYFLSKVALNNNVHAWFDEHRQFISAFSSGGIHDSFTVKSPVNAKYVRFTTTTENVDLCQFKLGTEDTPYEDYGLYLDVEKVKTIPNYNEKIRRGIRDGNIVCVGDSITSGQSDIRRYPFWLKAYLPMADIRNVGISGTSITYWILNIDIIKNLNPLPDTIVLNIGTNSTSSITKMIEDYTNLVNMYLDLGIKVVLVSLLPREDDEARLTILKQFNDFLKYTLAPTYGLPYVDAYSNFLNSDGTMKEGYMFADGLHPDVAGYQSMAKDIAETFYKIMPTPTRLWRIQDDTNVFVNPTFEIDTNSDGIADGWAPFTTTGVTATYQLLEHPDVGNWQQITRSGGVNNNSIVRLTQDITGLTQAHYLIGVDVDTDDVTDCEISVTYNFYDSSVVNLGGSNVLPRCHASIPNTRFELLVLSPENTDRIRISLNVLGSGSAVARYGRIMVKRVFTW